MEKLIIPINDKEQLEVYSHRGPFDQGVAALKAGGLELITARELAEARMLGGARHPVSTQWSWVAEHPVYLADRQADIIVVDRAHSRLLKYPVEATAAHRRGAEFYLDQEVVGELREQATRDGEYGVLLLPRKTIRGVIPVEALADDAYARFLFKDLAGRYGQFLRDAGINKVPVYVVGADDVRKQERPSGRALWVDDLSGRSGLDGYNYYYDLRSSSSGVRGIRRMHAAEQEKR